MKDCRGLTIATNDLVAVAERDGNVARLRHGKVVDQNEEIKRIKIKWTDGFLYGPEVSWLAVEGEVVHRPRVVVLERSI